MGKTTKKETKHGNYFLGASQQIRRNSRKSRMIQSKEQGREDQRILVLA